MKLKNYELIHTTPGSQTWTSKQYCSCLSLMAAKETAKETFGSLKNITIKLGDKTVFEGK